MLLPVPPVSGCHSFYHSKVRPDRILGRFDATLADTFAFSFMFSDSIPLVSAPTLMPKPPHSQPRPINFIDIDKEQHLRMCFLDMFQRRQSVDRLSCFLLRDP